MEMSKLGPFGGKFPTLDGGATWWQNKGVLGDGGATWWPNFALGISQKPEVVEGPLPGLSVVILQAQVISGIYRQIQAPPGG